jgi:hypothetical protein
MSDAMVRGYASLPFSQALVEEFSGVTSSDGAQSAPLSGNPTQLAYLPPDRMTAFCRLSRFGMTFKPLTESLGQDVLTSYLGDFPARTLVQPDEVPVLKESDPECGVIWRESLAKYDQDSSTWKTPQCSLLEDSTVFLGTWPRWGLMRDGVSYQQQTLVRHTKGTGSGSWPTPNAWDGKRGPRSEEHLITKKGQITLVTAVKRWPTPQASDNRDRGNMSNSAIQRRIAMGKQIMLSQSVDPNSGQLNPTWVEWLMGWPLGWTDLKPLATDKYQQWQQQHGIY